MTGGDDGIPELTEAEKIRIRAAESDVASLGRALIDGTATPDDVDSTFARVTSLDVDPHKQLDALHVPADAGPHTAALETILRRIPDGWGRWISVDAGWYPLVVATDQRFAELDADYVVQQIKEKFGTLRYYCTPSGDDPNTELLDAFDAITDDAERASAITCERCSEPGTLQGTRNRVKALCHACADSLGYAPASPPGLV